MNALSRLIAVFLGNKSERLYAYSMTQVGQQKCFRAPKEYGCADAVNTVFKECFGNEIGGDVSTTRLYEALNSSFRFVRVPLSNSLRGDIIISPTGYGNGSIPNGHVGVLGMNGDIMSNNSATGLWDVHLNMSLWLQKYSVQGGYPILIFRVVV